VVSRLRPLHRASRLGPVEIEDVVEIGDRRAVFEEVVDHRHEIGVEAHPADAAPPPARAFDSEVQADHLAVSALHILADDAVAQLEPLPFALAHGRKEEIVQLALPLATQSPGGEACPQVGIVHPDVELVRRLLTHPLADLGPSEPVGRLHLPREIEQRSQHSGRRQQFRDRRHHLDRHRPALPRRSAPSHLGGASQTTLAYCVAR
jgi:hypothetical protein